MPIKLKDLIARVPPEVEAQFRRVRDRTQRVVREALRAECRLTFRTAEESEFSRSGAQVPIEIVPGYPLVLDHIIFPDAFEHITLVGRYRRSLQDAHSGALDFMKLHHELLLLPEPDKWPSLQSDLHSVATWTAELLQLLANYDPLEKVLSVSEDVLGIYEYEAGVHFAEDQVVNRAKIRLYWGVIGLVSEWLGCGVADLAIVVLTHELAHAYTQLGADIEGRRWAATSFANVETALKEGLAQYYTDRVLHRDRPPSSGPGSMLV